MKGNIGLLTKFVSTAHGKQVRKYTGDPYVTHLLNVANMAYTNGIVFGYEIGLCHDLFEDTKTTEFELRTKLSQLEYSKHEIQFIVDSVWELTDVYTKENFPQLNREARKKLESERLWNISPNSQSVKYCDLLDNLSTIDVYDPGFAVVYKKEKEYLLRQMIHGNPKLLLMLNS